MSLEVVNHRFGGSDSLPVSEIGAIIRGLDGYEQVITNLQTISKLAKERTALELKLSKFEADRKLWLTLYQKINAMSWRGDSEGLDGLEQQLAILGDPTLADSVVSEEEIRDNDLHSAVALRQLQASQPVSNNQIVGFLNGRMKIDYDTKLGMDAHGALFLLHLPDIDTPETARVCLRYLTSELVADGQWGVLGSEQFREKVGEFSAQFGEDNKHAIEMVVGEVIALQILSGITGHTVFAQDEHGLPTSPKFDVFDPVIAEMSPRDLQDIWELMANISQLEKVQGEGLVRNSIRGSRALSQEGIIMRAAGVGDDDVETWERLNAVSPLCIPGLSIEAIKEIVGAYGGYGNETRVGMGVMDKMPALASRSARASGFEYYALQGWAAHRSAYCWLVKTTSFERPEPPPEPIEPPYHSPWRGSTHGERKDVIGDTIKGYQKILWRSEPRLTGEELASKAREEERQAVARMQLELDCQILGGHQAVGPVSTIHSKPNRPEPAPFVAIRVVKDRDTGVLSVIPDIPTFEFVDDPSV